MVVTIVLLVQHHPKLVLVHRVQNVQPDVELIQLEVRRVLPVWLDYL